MSKPTNLDQLFAALADPTRRAIVAELARGEATVLELAAPFDVSLATGKAPSARAEGSVTALDTVDLRVEGRTLIVRQRGGWNGAGKVQPVRVLLSTPDLRAASLLGTGRLQVDRMAGLLGITKSGL